MNWFKFHIGDYAQATAHLSVLEDGAYCRLLRKYYANERPLPADIAEVLRLVGARTREEKAAVESVLAEFFVLCTDGWRNKRADAEIAKANAQAEINKRIAEEREARRKALTANANADHDGTRIVNDSSNEPSGDREPSQTPDTRLQAPQTKTKPPPRFALPDWIPVDAWAAYEETRRRLRKPMTDRARELAIAKLDEIRGKGHDVRAVIEASVMNGWTGLFEPKPARGATRRPAPAALGMVRHTEGPAVIAMRDLPEAMSTIDYRRGIGPNGEF